VALLAVRLCGPELPCAPEAATDSQASGGCGAAGGANGSALVWLVIALSVLVWWSSRRRPSAGAITSALVALTAWVGCFDPTTREECRDRVCEGASGDGGAGADCGENWVCSPWEAEPGSDEATRTCTDENQAGTTACKPDEGPINLPALDLEYFKCQVMPVFQRGCAGMGCHGTDVGRPLRVYARGRLRNSEIVQRVDSCLETGTVNPNSQGEPHGARLGHVRPDVCPADEERIGIGDRLARRAQRLGALPRDLTPASRAKTAERRDGHDERANGLAARAARAAEPLSSYTTSVPQNCVSAAWFLLEQALRIRSAHADRAGPPVVVTR
jgi:hypothetical protein